jgi:hypothetical protein
VTATQAKGRTSPARATGGFGLRILAVMLGVFFVAMAILLAVAIAINTPINAGARVRTPSIRAKQRAPVAAMAPTRNTADDRFVIVSSGMTSSAPRAAPTRSTA